MKVGVLGIQGAVSEHVEMSRKAMQEMHIDGEVLIVKKLEQLEKIDALIIPGGESTTISSMLKRTGMFNAVIEKAKKGMGIMGTCAGSILLAKEVEGREVETLGLMDIAVSRNAYGRQIDSFECDVEIKDFDTPFHAVFIRAPVITRAWGEASVLATLKEQILMVKQNKFLALTFHPELSADMRIHKMFLNMTGSQQFS
jgi:5'-phosphate synthase pdxT subunit